MNKRVGLLFAAVCVVLICVGSITESVAAPIMFGADNAPSETVTIGSSDPESGFQFELELSSKGAAIRRATFSGFDDRDYKNPQPLEILSPIKYYDGSEILSMANKQFIFPDQKVQFPLDKLNWKSLGVEKDYDGSQTARFEAILKNKATDEPVIKLTKTYKIVSGSYMLDCEITVENVSSDEHNVGFNLSGPLGLGREGARADMRKVIGGFRNKEGRITTERIALKKLHKAESIDDRRLMKNTDQFLWAAAANKYFAAILVPVPDQGKDYVGWVADKTGRYFNPDGDAKGDTGDEAAGVELKIASIELAPSSSKTYNFQLYLGPKDKRLFDKNEQYKSLGFVQVIDFMACLCPAAMIQPMAFGILAAMEWIYKVIPNYGVVIIILVFLIRIVIHPLTKKSQVSMSKMQQLGPKMEAVKKKYANNKAEMNKQVMALYKEQGVSPIAGMLPMFAQMPIWISLYSAIYASVALRGAAFLPFWITDLSAPDALFRFTAVTLPLIGKLDSFNLLPLMMGVAFFLQQKLMPKPAAAATNPQAAQQQKMMMVMMPIMFPIMLYKAPSGLNLYIMASTFAGVIEQYIIRKHIREKQEAESQGLVAVTSKTGGKFKKKKPKPFFKNM